MKKNIYFVFVLLLCMPLMVCENTIMEKWWVTPEPELSFLSELYIHKVLERKGRLAELLQLIGELEEKAAAQRVDTPLSTEYEIRIKSDDTLGPENGILHYKDRKVMIRLVGNCDIKTISLKEDAKGSLFKVGSSVTLELKENIILKGHDDNNAALITVSEGGVLIMEEGVEIFGNNNRDLRGGGVSVEKGHFTMNGGEIHNNKTIYGGGICVMSGEFTMHGGKIYGNDASEGGGVYINIDDPSLSFFKKEPAYNGILTSGIICGSNPKDGLEENTAILPRGGGHAVEVHYQQDSIFLTRNETLDETDHISTNDRVSNWNL